MLEPVRRVQNSPAERVSRPAGAAATFHAASGSLAYVIALCSVAAIGGFLFGFDSGVINGAVEALAHAFGTHLANLLNRCGVERYVRMWQRTRPAFANGVDAPV